MYNIVFVYLPKYVILILESTKINYFTCVAYFIKIQVLLIAFIMQCII